MTTASLICRYPLLTWQFYPPLPNMSPLCMIASLCVVCTLQEFVVAMERCGMGLSAAQTTDLFHALDTNNTDSISFQVRAAQLHSTPTERRSLTTDIPSWRCIFYIELCRSVPYYLLKPAKNG
jgi:hypothetical protein